MWRIGGQRGGVALVMIMAMIIHGTVVFYHAASLLILLPEKIDDGRQGKRKVTDFVLL